MVEKLHAVHDGKNWVPVTNAAGNTGSKVPVPPVTDGDDTIFVSIPSFRDGKRCAATIKSLFENAKHPEKVIVGLIEQNTPDDAFCIETYCSLYGTPKILERQKIRADTTKVMARKDGADPSKTCPHYDQIRLVAVHNIAAKGPGPARALGRKVLGNEEYCLQIDSHTSFTKDWDDIAKQEWLSAQNEFAILSTVPADMAQQSEYETEGSNKFGEVPRQCLVKFDGENVPNYEFPADGKATNLEKPLLSHAWSAGFSFAKCHLEESAPYDPFAYYIMGGEQFPRFARFWTRGYDVYTPTRNIVYHDYNPNPDGHDTKEWMKPRYGRQKMEALHRMRTILQIGDEDTSEKVQANFGLYGLGKRRTLPQMMDFIGIDTVNKHGNMQNKRCGDKDWVPYDSSISPMENLYQNADDLDPQPEFPMRTNLIFYKQEAALAEPPHLDIPIDQENLVKEPSGPVSTGAPPSSVLLLFWVVGLIVWCAVYVTPTGKSTRRRMKKGASGKEV